MKFQKLQNEKDYTNILDIFSTDRKYRSDYNYFYIVNKTIKIIACRRWFQVFLYFSKKKWVFIPSVPVPMNTQGKMPFWMKIESYICSNEFK